MGIYQIPIADNFFQIYPAAPQISHASIASKIKSSTAKRAVFWSSSIDLFIQVIKLRKVGFVSVWGEFFQINPPLFYAFLSIILSMGWTPEDEYTILFCPQCGYKPHENDYLNLQSNKEVHSLSIKPTEEVYVCNKCNFSGSLFAIPEKDRYKLEFDLDELESPLKHAQKGSKRIYLYLLGLLVIILSIIQTSGLLLPVVLTIVLAALILYLELRARSR